MFKDCVQKGELTESMKQGIITLIPKPNKDSLHLDNWRPITLLNSDYKLLASLYANRLKPCLEEIVSVSQSGFMKGRHIANNIRLVLDILDYKELINDKAVILFLYFSKAFDTVEHEFMFEFLRRFGFGHSFIKIVQTFYKNINSNVSLVNGVSPRFVISRGIRQGCPISHFLFVLVAEFLNIFITHCLDVQGILVAEHTFLISQLANDTCLFLKDEKQVPVILDALNLFSNASGLSVNRNKSEIMPVHSLDIDQIEGIEVKKSVRYLGILINKSPTDRIVDNFLQKIQKSKNIFNCWLQRN